MHSERFTVFGGVACCPSIPKSIWASKSIVAQKLAEAEMTVVQGLGLPFFVFERGGKGIDLYIE